MGLDKQVLEIDGKGILPGEFETVEEYVERGNRTLKYAHNENTHELVQYLNMSGMGCNNLWAMTDESSISSAIEKFDERFGCDMSWVSFYCGDMELGTKSYAQRVADFLINKEDGIHYIPSFVAVNSNHHGTYNLLLHELSYIARYNVTFMTSLHDQPRFEERMANYVAGKPEVFNPSLEVGFDFLRGKALLRRAFGEMANYTLIRISCDELCDFFVDGLFGTKDPKKVICAVAEKPHRLRYQILKEKLRL